jgi:hypothetical protein
MYPGTSENVVTVIGIAGIKHLSYALTGIRGNGPQSHPAAHIKLNKYIISFLKFDLMPYTYIMGKYN